MAIADVNGTVRVGGAEILSRWCATQPRGPRRHRRPGQKRPARCCGLQQDGDHRVVGPRPERTCNSFGNLFG